MSAPWKFCFGALVLGLFFTSEPALGQITAPAIIDSTHSSMVDLNGHLYFLEDPSHELSLHTIVNEDRKFETAGETTPNFGFTKSTYWFHFSLTNHTPDSLLLLELRYPLLDHVDFYQRDADGGFEVSSSGDMVPFSHRARDHRTVTFEMAINPGKTRKFYLSARTTSSLQFPLRVYTEKAFANHVAGENIALGLYYGIILIMLLFNGLLWVNLKEKSYFSFSGFLGCYLVFQLCLNGNAYKYLFPESPHLHSIALPLSSFLALAFGCRFASQFLVWPYGNNFWRTLLNRGEKLWLICALLAAILPYSITVKVVVVAFLIMPWVFIASGITSAKSGFAPARIYLGAWISVITGVFIYGSKTAGFLPPSSFTEYAIQVGSVLLVVLLSLALADRINLIQADRNQAKASEAAAHFSMKQSYETLNQELERRVTAEISAIAEYKARSYLVAETAHRLNNPLNITLGSLETLAAAISEHKEFIMGMVDPADAESDEGKAIIQSLELKFSDMLDSTQDAKVAVLRAADFLKELRALSGAAGDQSQIVEMSRVFHRSKNRLDANLGPHSWKKLNIDPILPGLMIWGNEYVLSALLEYVIREIYQQGATSISIYEPETPCTYDRLPIRIVGVNTTDGIRDSTANPLTVAELVSSIGGDCIEVNSVTSNGGVGYDFKLSRYPPPSNVEVAETSEIPLKPSTSPKHEVTV